MRRSQSASALHPTSSVPALFFDRGTLICEKAEREFRINARKEGMRIACPSAGRTEHLLKTAKRTKYLVISSELKKG
jgi:hypothetical protein